MSSPRLSRTSLPGLGTFVLTSSTTSSSSAAANISENNNNNTLVVDVDASPRREYPISRTPDTIIVTPASWRPPPIPKRMSLAHPTLQLHHHSPKHRQNHSPTSSQSSTSPMSTQREERSSSILSLTTSADSPISNIAIIMLGLGLRHACLNNVSADPPAKDTPHACYISLRPIAIGDYLRRFDKFAQCSDECYAVAAVLLDRWCAATGVQLHRSIVHKLTLTALVVALKMYDDQQYPMDWRAGGWRGDARADGAGASLPAHDRVACRCGPRRVRAVRGHNASGDVTADVRALSCARWVWQQCCALYTEGRQPPLSAGASDLSACGVA
eukprot:PhM_4_TR388/c5_g1_i1/m.106711